MTLQVHQPGPCSCSELPQAPVPCVPGKVLHSKYPACTRSPQLRPSSHMHRAPRWHTYQAGGSPETGPPGAPDSAA